MITFVGVEGVGKTTLSKHMAKRLGGSVLSVAPWPALGNFLTSPSTHAYDNQRQAMSYTIAAQRDAMRTGPLPLFADTSPDRIHLVHSWNLRRAGLLGPDEWLELDGQYEQARIEWGTHYVYLHASLKAIRDRIVARGRPEDIEYNMQSVATFMQRWEELVMDAAWRQDKQILELETEQTPDELCDITAQWIQERGVRGGEK